MAKILVVDDSVTLRLMVAQVLEEDGHDVSKAVSGEDAIMKLNGFTPDLILTDLYMPGIDGITLAEKVRTMAEYQKTPILILSTDNSPELKQRGKNSGVNGWITKPFDPGILQQVITKVLH